ncbi:MAG: hypothetical protein GYA41_04515 [Bacteroidales bacterium]|nr:hypothetical protein [Bacteroidales bacterium]
MDTQTAKIEVRIFSEKRTRANNTIITRPDGDAVNCRAIENLIAEGGSNFVRYLGWLDMLKEKNIILLSPKRHYFFDHSELKCSTTLILLKKLNLLEDSDGLLRDISRAIIPGSSLLGHFSGSHKRSGRTEAISNIYSRIIDFLDIKIHKGFDSQSVVSLIESNGFQVADMTLIKNTIYFRAIKK